MVNDAFTIVVDQSRMWCVDACLIVWNHLTQWDRLVRFMPCLNHQQQVKVLWRNDFLNGGHLVVSRLSISQPALIPSTVVRGAASGRWIGTMMMLSVQAPCGWQMSHREPVPSIRWPPGCVRGGLDSIFSHGKALFWCLDALVRPMNSWQTTRSWLYVNINNVAAVWHSWWSTLVGTRISDVTS